MMLAPLPVSERLSDIPVPGRMRSRRGLLRLPLLRHRLAVAGGVVLILLLLSALLAQLLPYDPNRTSLIDRFGPPSLVHPMGTDDLGRDEVTRVLFGGRISLSVGAGQGRRQRQRD